MPPPACWRHVAKPSPARKRWSRLAARARRAGRALPRSLSAQAASMSNCAGGHAGARLDRRRSGRDRTPAGVSAPARLPLEWLSAAATRAREPRLAGKIAGALFSPQDHQVDNRKLAQALRVAAEAAGVKIHEHRPVKDIVVAGRPRQRRRCSKTARSPRRCRRARRRRLVARHRRVAAGSAAAGASGQRARCCRCGWMPPRRCSITCCGRRAFIWCRGVTAGLLSAATVEEKGFDDTITAGGMLTLAGSRMARGAGDRRVADRRNLGRSSSRQPRRCADPRPRAAAKACCMRPVIIATAFCSRR